MAAGLAVAAPTLIAFNLPPSATFFNQAAALAGWGIWLVLLSNVSPRRSRRIGSGLAALLAALAVLLLAALASPLWTGLTWPLVLSSVGLIAAAGLAASVASAARHAGLGVASFRAFCVALLVAGAGSALIGIVQVFVPAWADGNWIARSAIEGRAVGNLRQPNHLSSLLLWSMIALAWLGEIGLLRRAVSAGLMLPMLLALVLGASRTGMLGVAMLAVWGVLDARLSRSTRVMLWLMPLLYVVLWIGVASWAHEQQHVFGGETQLTKADISSSRFGIWSNTFALIAAHPWLGVGFGEFNFAWSLTPFPGRPVAFFDHTHNLPLQFAVELGLPLASLVLALLAWALWRALSGALQTELDANKEQASMPRAAFVMVLMICVHSLLEYPLWYAYFLLPAAFAFGLCLGGPAMGDSLVAQHKTDRPATRPLLVASMLLVFGGAVSVLDYLRVVTIFAPPANAAPLAQRIADGQQSWFFSHHADYAAVTTAEHPSQVMPAFAGATHYLLDARLMMAWAKALDEAGDSDRARYVAQRLKEFRNEQADEFFAPCKALPKDAKAAPFQCLEPTKPLSYEDFR